LITELDTGIYVIDPRYFPLQLSQNWSSKYNFW